MNGMIKCPACRANMTLKNGAIPAHLPGWLKGHRLCAASGWCWTDNIYTWPWATSG